MEQFRLKKLMRDIELEDFAKAKGVEIHSLLAHIVFCNGDFIGDEKIISRIKENRELREIMGPLSRPEVSLAGYVNNTFLSRRIDRLYVNLDTKTVMVVDYKTDADKGLYYEKYRVQLSEYSELLKQVYPGFVVRCKILWLSDFTLENVI